MKPFRTLVIPVTIAALAIAGLTSTPARAANDDLTKLLIGLGAVAIVATAIENSNKSEAATTTRNNRVVTIPQTRVSKRAKYALSSDCLRTYTSNGGDRKFFKGTCVRKANKNLADLPKACEYRIAGKKGSKSKVYGPTCLKRNGFYVLNPKSKMFTNSSQHIVWNK